MQNIYKSTLLILLLTTGFRLKAQLQIDTAYTAEDLVRNVLLNEGDQWDISNIRFFGSKQSAGVFSCDLKYNEMIQKGLILSTGNVFDAIGPNISDDMSGQVKINPDKQLEQIAKGKTFDAAVLQFEFVAKSDSITFNFFFGSEEYPEYVNKNVNDVFGFFLRDLETNAELNLALIKPGNIPITVDNINGLKNKNWFIRNGSWNENDPEKYANNKKLGELAVYFQYDGFTKLIPASAPTTKGKRYRLKLAIADVGDRNLDSGIFIEAGSFKAGGPGFAAATIPVDKLIKGLGLPTKRPADDVISVSYNVQFDTDSFRIRGSESFIVLNKIALIMKKNKTVKLDIAGHTDKVGALEYNQKLSTLRAASVRNYLVAKGVEADRLSYSGYGSSQPLTNENTSENRRVEFLFKTD